MENTIYPQPVLDRTQEAIKDLQETNFFELEECTTTAAEIVLNEFFLDKFIKGDPLEFDSDAETKETLGLIILESTFASLKEKLPIDIFIDETTGNMTPIFKEK